MSRERFIEILKDEFAPKLREVGFSGSSLNFRRVDNDVIHAINIQGNKWGGSCAVNLGIHLTFLPMAGRPDLKPDIKTMKEVDCAFRRRLSPDGKADHWWKYDGDGWLGSPERSAQSLVDIFFKVGEPYFQKHSTVEAIIAGLDYEAIVAGRHEGILRGTTTLYAALLAARIHKHLGNVEAAQRFARLGLQKLGGAFTLKPELEELAG